MSKLLAFLLCLSILLIITNSWANTRKHLFHIAKSENRNQVHYAIVLDDKCLPASTSSVYAYWLMLEKGPTVIEGLLDREQQAYGIAYQNTFGNKVYFTLNAIPTRSITVETFSDKGVCSVRTSTTISGQPSILKSIYIDLWWVTVKQITVYGNRISDGVAIQENLK